jgi:membrane associated rhomboid family serine protease
MVLELEDDKVPFYTQYVSVAIIIINIIVFVVQLLDPTGYMFVYEAAFIPRDFFEGRRYWTIITSMFMHGDFLHILFNMWFFFVVADNCEKAMGHLYFLITYIVSGIVAALLHALFTLLVPFMLDIPTLGASGAIFGIIAVYGILFPKNKLGLLGSTRMRKISAQQFILIYFVTEIIYAIFSLGASGTAHMAHVGGFIAGAFFAYLFKLFSKKY